MNPRIIRQRYGRRLGRLLFPVLVLWVAVELSAFLFLFVIIPWAVGRA